MTLSGFGGGAFCEGSRDYKPARIPSRKGHRQIFGVFPDQRGHRRAVKFSLAFDPSLLFMAMLMPRKTKKRSGGSRERRTMRPQGARDEAPARGDRGF